MTRRTYFPTKSMHIWAFKALGFSTFHAVVLADGDYPIDSNSWITCKVNYEY